VPDFDVATPFGTDSTTRTPMYQDTWTALMAAAMGDGIVDPVGNVEIQVTATGSDTNVTMSAGHIAIAGFLGVATSPKSVDIDDDGAPGVGVQRMDWIVAKVNRTTQVISFECVPGDPGSGTLPALVRDRSGNVQHPIAWIDRTGPISVTNGMIHKTNWRPSPGYFADTGAPQPDGVPIGSTLVQGSDLFVRARVGSTVVWRNLFDPAWSNLALPAAYEYPAGARPQYRVINGGVEFRGTIRLASGTWTAGATPVIATFTVSVRDQLGGSNWDKRTTGAFYSQGLTVHAVGVVRVAMADTGGSVSLPYVPVANLRLVDLDGIRVYPAST
jgi:hypothetical protein